MIKWLEDEEMISIIWMDNNIRSMIIMKINRGIVKKGRQGKGKWWTNEKEKLIFSSSSSSYLPYSSFPLSLWDIIMLVKEGSILYPQVALFIFLKILDDICKRFHLLFVDMNEIFELRKSFIVNFTCSSFFSCFHLSPF